MPGRKSKVATLPFTSKAVAARFQSYPLPIRRKLLALRKMVILTARSIPEVGDVEETIKWGEPAYVPPKRVGSTVRIDWKPRAPGQYAMYFHCQTNLVESFRTMFPNEFGFEGNRALVFELDARIPEDALRVCIAASLTYHSSRRARLP